MAQVNPADDGAGAVKPGKSVHRTSLARPALLAFVAISVALIVMIWVDNLTAEKDQTPGYYHGEFLIDPGHYATVTAEAIQFELTLAVTPEPLSTTIP